MYTDTHINKYMNMCFQSDCFNGFTSFKSSYRHLKVVIVRQMILKREELLNKNFIFVEMTVSEKLFKI